ncbi:MAG: histidine phosphatase family protein [Candidatus Latescibacteria bacterium]|nr:histidine phosphatase family protein [Candidatus Latescibacterota bacterium]
MLTIYLIRHGEVHNPKGIIYGHLPGYGLSHKGREQLVQAAGLLEEQGPFQALYVSPLQRAQESAQILGEHLGLGLSTEPLIVETGVGGYQGQLFSALPRPYMTEEATVPGIECAASIRRRFLSWVRAMLERHAGGQLIAVSHRDPIAVSLLYWMGMGLDELPEFPLEPGGVYQVRLETADRAAQVEALG